MYGADDNFHLQASQSTSVTQMPSGQWKGYGVLMYDLHYTCIQKQRCSNRLSHLLTEYVKACNFFPVLMRQSSTVYSWYKGVYIIR